MKYYWRFAVPEKAIEDTVIEVLKVIRDNGYTLNELQEADCEAQIEGHLERAEQGRLIPSVHVKRVQSSPDIDMYEIRWDDIAATEVDKVSGIIAGAKALQLRLYYVEVGKPWVVGIHVHEKEVLEDADETRARQNYEISRAVEIAIRARGETWGIPELGIPGD